MWVKVLSIELIDFGNNKYKHHVLLTVQNNHNESAHTPNTQLSNLPQIVWFEFPGFFFVSSNYPFRLLGVNKKSKFPSHIVSVFRNTPENPSKFSNKGNTRAHWRAVQSNTGPAVAWTITIHHWWPKYRRANTATFIDPSNNCDRWTNAAFSGNSVHCPQPISGHR